MTIITDVITKARRRYSARRTYNRLGDNSYDLGARLYRTTDPAERAELLTARADTLSAQAINYPVAFGGDWAIDPILSARADLLRLAAASERMLIDPAEAKARRALEDRLGDLPPAEARVWLDIAHTHDRAERSQMLIYAADLASERVGGEAAETLHDVAEQEGELAAAPVPSTVPQAMAIRTGIASLLAIVGAIIATPAIPGFNTWPPSLQLLALFAGPVLLAVIGRLIWRHHDRAARAVRDERESC